MKNFSGIVAWYSADHISGTLLFSPTNISKSLIFTLNSKIAIVFETEIYAKLNCEWTIIAESR